MTPEEIEAELLTLKKFEGTDVKFFIDYVVSGWLKEKLAAHKEHVIAEVGSKVLALKDTTDPNDDFSQGKKHGHNSAINQVLLHLSHMTPTE